MPTCGTPENASPSSGSDTLIESESESESELELALLGLGLDDKVEAGADDGDTVSLEGLGVAEVFAAALLVATVDTELELTSLR